MAIYEHLHHPSVLVSIDFRDASTLLSIFYADMTQ